MFAVAVTAALLHIMNVPKNPNSKVKLSGGKSIKALQITDALPEPR